MRKKDKYGGCSGIKVMRGGTNGVDVVFFEEICKKKR